MFVKCYVKEFDEIKLWSKVFTFPFKAIDLILEMEMRWANFCWHTFNYVTVRYPQIQELCWLIILQKSIIRFQFIFILLFIFESFDHYQKSQKFFVVAVLTVKISRLFLSMGLGQYQKH